MPAPLTGAMSSRARCPHPHGFVVLLERATCARSKAPWLNPLPTPRGTELAADAALGKEVPGAHDPNEPVRVGGGCRNVVVVVAWRWQRCEAHGLAAAIL